MNRLFTVILAAISRLKTFQIIQHPSVSRWSLIPPFLALSGFLTAGSAETLGDFTYTVTNDTVIINGYVGSSGNAIIPEEIDGKEVTTIAPQSFSRCTNLTTIEIPSTVTQIGQ